MRKTTIEKFPLTLREEEAEKECRANYRPLQSLPKPARVTRVKRLALIHLSEPTRQEARP